MVQEFSPLKSHSSYLSDALAPQLGAGLGNFLGSYFAKQALDKLRNDPSMKDAPVSERLSKLNSTLAMHGSHGQRILSNELGAEQQRLQESQQKRQENEQIVLGKFASGEPVSAKERSKLSPKTQLELQKLEKNKKQASNMKQALIKAGVDEVNAENFADVYESATEGGKTELLKQYNDMLRRAKQGFYRQNENKPEQELDIDKPTEWENLPLEEGMTPAEEIKQKANREKHNLPIYEETNKILSGLEDEHRDIKRLQQLEERENLPEGVEKWDINWETGEPRFSPATLHPDAQLYLKTIASMLGKAKEFFPGRVTNFDLDTFRKRFPTLANSKEGRILIQKQLELANRIAYLREDLLSQAFEHYGAGADPIKVRQIAKKKYNEQKQVLEERLKNLDGLLEQEYQKNLGSKNEIPQGNVKVRSPDGMIGSIPEKNIEAAIKAGYERL